MNQKESLKVAIDARVMAGKSGGVGQAIMSLIHDLGRLDGGAEAYTVVVASAEQAQRLQSYLGENQQIVIKPKAESRRLSWHKRPLRRLARYLNSYVDNNSRQWPEVPISDGFYESLGCGVIHFMNQLDYVLCALPTVYNPHDLQHLHYPQYWTPSVIAQRERVYRAGCHFSRTVVVGSKWIKDDIIRQYRVDPDKVQIIPEGPPTQACPEPSEQDLSTVKEKYQLEQPFVIYPAVTWQHKNHIRLLEALAYLRDTRGLTVRLVCTGSLYAFWPRIEQRIDELNLRPQVKFLGFVPETELRSLYRLSQFLVMPTLFEASSLPIFEAWYEGVPVASSNVTALPDQVLDAALMFDPCDTKSIANAIEEMATNDALRQELIASGYRRLRDFDCERTARAYRAVYRRAAGHPLTEEDRWLLGWDWMQNPERKMETTYQ
jgi:glycosyltransferase involved in cell wall biosynthesis